MDILTPPCVLLMILCCVQTIQYISDMGGVFGLWFGFALLAFIELCEFITDLVLLGIWRITDAVGCA